MGRFLLLPDSFKGTLSAGEICDVMTQAIRTHLPHGVITAIPVADGGEGTVDCFVRAVGAEKVPCTVTGPLGRPVEAFYGRLDAETAVVEMAAAAGLPLVGETPDPMGATTYGVGELILAAAQNGAKHIIVGLGGSATNDGGVGAALAVGAVFRDVTGAVFTPTAGTLERIAAVDASTVGQRLSGVRFTAMCDIDNPLCGPRGAAHVFGPQKGADPEQVKQLDRGHAHLAEVLRRDLKRDVLDLPGAGAAGGLGAGMVAFFGAELRRGIDAVLDAVGFETLLEDTELIFTGEGKIDGQSLGGKVVLGISRRAKEKGVPVIAVVGGAEEGAKAAYDQGVTAIFPINRLPQEFAVSRLRSRENLRDTMDDILRLYLIN